MPDDLLPLHEKLAALVKARNYRQVTLAHQSGIHPSMISKYLKGDAVPRSKSLKALLAVLGEPYEEFVAGTSMERAYRAAGPAANLCLNPECPGRKLAQHHATIATFLGTIEGVRFPAIDDEGDPIEYCSYCGDTLVSRCWYCWKPIANEHMQYCYSCGASLYLTCTECRRPLLIDPLDVMLPEFVASLYDSGVSPRANADRLRRSAVREDWGLAGQEATEEESASSPQADVPPAATRPPYLVWHVEHDQELFEAPFLWGRCRVCDDPGEKADRYVICTDLRTYEFILSA